MNETECNFYEPEEGRTPEPVMKAIAIDRETGKIIGGIGLDDRDFPRQQVVTGNTEYPTIDEQWYTKETTEIIRNQASKLELAKRAIKEMLDAAFMPYTMEHIGVEALKKLDE